MPNCMKCDGTRVLEFYRNGRVTTTVHCDYCVDGRMIEGEDWIPEPEWTYDDEEMWQRYSKYEYKVDIIVDAFLSAKKGWYE